MPSGKRYLDDNDGDEEDDVDGVMMMVV